MRKQSSELVKFLVISKLVFSFSPLFYSFGHYQMHLNLTGSWHTWVKWIGIWGEGGGRGVLCWFPEYSIIQYLY